MKSHGIRDASGTPFFSKKKKKGEKMQDSVRFGARRPEFFVFRLPLECMGICTDVVFITTPSSTFLLR